MSETTVEKKLELVQQIRSQHNRNQFDLLNREQILYGRTMPREAYTNENPAEEAVHIRSTFRLRLLAAGILFVLIIVLDATGKSLAGFKTQEIFTMLAQDYKMNIDSWVAANSE